MSKKLSEMFIDRQKKLIEKIVVKITENIFIFSLGVRKIFSDKDTR